MKRTGSGLARHSFSDGGHFPSPHPLGLPMGRSPTWMKLAMDSWSLGLEASTVVGMRMVKLSQGGPAAAAEAERMVREKIHAAADFQRLAFTGALGATSESAATKTVSDLRKKVRANRRRLGRSRS